MSKSSASPRKLSLHERYALSRRCVGSASVVSVAAILRLKGLEEPTQAFAALERHLEDRIDQALFHYPLLGYCVRAPRSKAPRWSPSTPAPTCKDILHVGAPLTAQPDQSKLLSQAMLSEQASLSATTSLEQGPLWKVQLHPIRDEPLCLIILSTDHVINDGRGTLNLFTALLSTEPLAAATHAPVPPASDHVFDFKPSTAYMLGVVWKELILPKLPLPKRVKAKLTGAVSWPASPTTSGYDIVKTPKGCPQALDVIFVTAPDLIRNLKRLAQLHSAGGKAATLHAVLHNLALVALYAAIANDVDAAKRFEVVLGSCTPISLREEARPAKKGRVDPSATSAPLPPTTGNYVSSYTQDFRLRPSTAFWTLTNRFSGTLASPAGRRAAKQHMGLLAYIPDFEKRLDDQDDVEKTLGTDRCANGWEKFFADKAASSTPFDSALTVSNLGVVDLSAPIASWSVERFTWSQSHTPQGEAFGVDIVTCTHSLSLALSSRPSAFADVHLHDRFKSYLHRLLLAFAAEQTSEKQESNLDLSSNLTVSQLAHFLITP